MRQHTQDLRAQLLAKIARMRLSKHARRTYADPQWWFREGVEKRRTIVQLVVLAKVQSPAIRRWYRLMRCAGVVPTEWWADRQLEERQAFGRWLYRTKSRRAVLRRLKPQYRRMLFVWYVDEPLPVSASALARKRHCSREYVTAERHRALKEFHAQCPIPSRFWRITLYVRGTRRFAQYKVHPNCRVGRPPRRRA